MKLKNAIDTAVSHNALVVLEETDPKILIIQLVFMKEWLMKSLMNY